MLLPPRVERLKLLHICPDGNFLVAICAALLQAPDECLAGFDAVWRARKEEVLLRVLAGECRTEQVIVRHTPHVADARPACGAGSRENHFPDQLRLLQHDFLGNHAAHRKPEQIDLFKPNSIDEGNGIVCHLFHRIRR